MSGSWTDKRREFRFQLKGNFSKAGFALGSHRVAAEPIDISRTGLGILVDATWHQDAAQVLILELSDPRSPIALEFRFQVQETHADKRPRTRCGLELSDRDKHRGIDLISLLSSEPHLRLLLA